MVIMYFAVSVVNNWALNFEIPMPLHMIFRAGSLIANMIMGMIILGRRYSNIKYFAVLAIRYVVSAIVYKCGLRNISVKLSRKIAHYIHVIIFTFFLLLKCRYWPMYNDIEQTDYP